MDSSQSADPLLPQPDEKPPSRSRSPPRKRPLFFTVCALLAAASLGGLAFLFVSTREDKLQNVPELQVDIDTSGGLSTPGKPHSAAYVVGEPKQRFRGGFNLIHSCLTSSSLL